MTDSLEPRDQLAVLTRRWWVIVLCAVLVGGAALTGALVQTPIYAASTDILVERAGTNTSVQPLNDALFGDQELATQLQVLASLPVAERAAETLGIGLDAEQLLRRTKARLVPDTRVIQVTARDPDPARAQEIAQTMAQSYLDFRRDIALEQVLGATADLVERTRAIRNRIAELDDQLAADPGDVAAAQERDVLLEQLGQLSAQLTTLEATEAFARGGGQVLRPAKLPSVPVEPQPIKQTALGLILGMAIGVGAALLAERLDDRAATLEEISRVAGGQPVLVSLPRLPTDPGVQLTSHPYGQFAEATRTLLANIRLSRPRSAVKILLVTSPGAGEGKSTVALNIAVASGLSGTRTILLDADLRKPRVREMLNLPAGDGFAELLRGQTTLEAVAVDPGIANLRVITAGRPTQGPVELLSGPMLRDTIAACGKVADLVVIDAPPALGLADALPLCVQADATLLVVDERAASRRRIEEAVTRLQRVGATLVGIVGNRGSGGEDSDTYYAYTERPHDSGVSSAVGGPR